ncbi:cyclic nucleotide-binding domain protein (macronuclear) [Tetrahymena thermophila SB210]|uniref:Cyclic nucleotide-binding domain protein n=1 Tax=Tetrahymena thermophila (strain SB210) TaxID=312017 RepID=Q22YK7_TETTS|nr:cyclic nucleotide-binding domain protein [Tetrahymena thermophila SB210]EAR90278.2 cyclic nucleotide-binding domain protein [Tetrahymena thermophila SB210]|eukprot:XP_001010523.2 cyclic nucleotide-binding domain protein [Tetrahymena thermophila SB210]
MFLNADDFLNYSLDKESEKLIDHYVYYYDNIKTQKKRQPKVKENFLEYQKPLMQQAKFPQKRVKSSNASRNALSRSFDENQTTLYKNKNDKMSLFNIAEEKALLSEMSEENFEIQGQNRNHYLQQNIGLRKVKKLYQKNNSSTNNYPNSNNWQQQQQQQDQPVSQQNIPNLKRLSVFTTVQSINSSTLLNQTGNSNGSHQKKFPSIKKPPPELDNLRDISSTDKTVSVSKGFRIVNNKPNNINFLSPKSEKLFEIYTNSNNNFNTKTLSTQSDVKSMPPKKLKQQKNSNSPVKVTTERISRTSMSRQRQYSFAEETSSPSNNINQSNKKKQKDRCRSSLATQQTTQNDEEQTKRKKSLTSKNAVYKSIDLSYDKLRYQQICNRLSLRVATIPQDFSERDELFLKDLLTDLRTFNTLFAKFQYFTGMHLLTVGKMYQVNKKSIYTEKSQGVSFYIILYGRVILKTKAEGIYKECIMGDTFGEDYIITKQEDKRQETAKATDETCILEFYDKDLETLKCKCLKDHLRDDFTKLLSLIRRGYLSKKSSKQNVAFKNDIPQMVYS